MIKNIIEMLKEYDPEVGAGIEAEYKRQKRGLELIASENLVSEPVMLAMGTHLTNKYAEGYPAHRYYGGCECVDVVENIAIERACKLFGAEHANVQPHSGANANLAVFFALLNPGDTVMGMNLQQGGPLEHIIASKAVCFGEGLKPSFKEYQQKIVENAKALAEGLLAGGFNLVSGGTDNHLMLVDLRPFNITGKELEHRLDEVYITVNKNAIHNDPEKPFVTSGIRIGTPAVTTRGLGVEEMEKIAEYIYLCATDFENKADEIRAGVTAICEKFPLYM